MLAVAGIDGHQPWAVIHPGASAESRRYPWTCFAHAARRLVNDFGWPVVLTGDSSEIDLVEKIRHQMGCAAVSVAGCLTLAELAAVIGEAPLLISNNTGPVHIAAALGTPVVDLYALTNPQHTPWGVPNRVLSHVVPCQNCYKSVCPEAHNNCLTLIPPEAIVDAAAELMNRTPVTNHRVSALAGVGKV
jgi:ADP-heptose:LPS heptosyltransferase